MVFAQVNYKAFQGYFFIFSIVFVSFQTRLSIVVVFFFLDSIKTIHNQILYGTTRWVHRQITSLYFSMNVLWLYKRNAMWLIWEKKGSFETHNWEDIFCFHFSLVWPKAVLLYCENARLSPIYLGFDSVIDTINFMWVEFLRYLLCFVEVSHRAHRFCPFTNFQLFISTDFNLQFVSFVLAGALVLHHVGWRA